MQKKVRYVATLCLKLHGRLMVGLSSRVPTTADIETMANSRSVELIGNGRTTPRALVSPVGLMSKVAGKGMSVWGVTS